MKSYEAMEEEALAVRRDIIEMLYQAGSGHPGGSLSVTDILVCLYNRIRVDAAHPDLEDRDRVVLSKGHAAPALYAVLAEHGFFSKESFKRLRKLGGVLQGPPDMNKTPGVDVCTGSLGLGVSTACGIALAGKVRKKDYRVYAVLGDGELQEGIVWDAMA
ncbi:MAG: 1-deoxy-D-xylulose-5-phosphate synthase N-terminal domain-containing protein, partial [Hungatella sp.]